MLLSKYASSNQSSEPFKIWSRNNLNFTQAIAVLKKYAYRPHCGTLDNGMVDTRTFFYIREFLYQMEAENRRGAFVVTWALNFTENKKTQEMYTMPFNTNNIDLTVSANVIYGLTSAALGGLSDPNEWFDLEVQMIYENTTNLLVWAIKQNFSGRPDIALTYYPSMLNFYWFTARTLNLIQTYGAAELPFSVIGTVKEKLIDVMQNVVSPTMLKMAVDNQEDATIYFEEFLGGNDRNLFGKFGKIIMVCVKLL